MEDTHKSGEDCITPPVPDGGMALPPVRPVHFGLPGRMVPPPPPPMPGKVTPPPVSADICGVNADDSACLPKVPPVPEMPGQGEGPEKLPRSVSPEIVFEPLHVLDPLCVKWGFGVGVVRRGPEPVTELPKRVQEVPGVPAPVFLSSPSLRAPVSSKSEAGYVRLVGLLSNGSLWECTLAYAEMSRPGGKVIGRDPGCSQIVLPEVSISRCHTRVEYIDNRVVVTDMGSTNGTFVNGLRLAPNVQRMVVDDGNILTLGKISLRVELMPPPASLHQ